MKASFDALAAKEAAALADARYVTGRTAFDRAACAALAPPRPLLPLQRDITSAVLYGYAVACAGLCRRAGAAAPQGNYPLKNLHTVIKALPAVLAEYGDAELRIAGWLPLDKGARCCARSLTECSPTSSTASGWPRSWA